MITCIGIFLLLVVLLSYGFYSNRIEDYDYNSFGVKSIKVKFKDSGDLK